MRKHNHGNTAASRPRDYIESREDANQRIFIVGAGRSGTSLLAGMFRQCGLFMGTSFYRIREANPHGFFEDRAVNAINEKILRPYLASGSDGGSQKTGADFNATLREGQRWLAGINASIPIIASEPLQQRIRRIYNNGPSCLKDPRFCYTLNAWANQLSSAEVAHMQVLCIFRHPSIVAASIIRELNTAAYLSNLSLDYASIFQHWKKAYKYLLINHVHLGKWLFISYESLFTDSGLNRVENFTNFKLDRELPSQALNRSSADTEADQDCIRIYNQLLSLSSTSDQQ